MIVRMSLLFILTVALDQGSKWFVRQQMTLGESIAVLKECFRITYIENPGIAFGIRVGNNTLFTILSILASAGVLIYLVLHREEKPGIQYGLVLILGGAFGNLIDRLIFRQVADFIDLGIGHLRWWVFNVADSAVVIGMIVLMITVIIADRKSAAAKTD